MEKQKISSTEMIDFMGDEHVSSSADTPLRADAFEMDDDLKIELIEKHFREIKSRGDF